MNEIIFYSLLLLVIQIILTYYFTNTKRFSVQACAMNLSWLYAFYYFYKTKQIKYLMIPIILRILFLIINITYGNIPKYITTDYLYSDFFENIIKNNKCCEFYTEGDYNGLLPFNTIDKNKDLEMDIQNMGLTSYNNAINSKNDNIFNEGIMKKSQINKYKWIVENLGITSNSKVLELGFGKIDLMNYIRSNTGATVEGTNLSLEQIQTATELGFKCYHINHEDLSNYIDILDRYDVIITNGTLEYLVNLGENGIKYETFADNIYKLLVPCGKWYTTTIHVSDDFIKEKNERISYDLIEHYLKNENSFMNIYNLYYLAIGNEGSYPVGRNGLIDYVKGRFKVVLQQDRTIDYLLFSYNWLICQINNDRNDSLLEKIKKNINHLICFFVAPLYYASYICYTPTSDWRYQPWLWQFLRQDNGYRPVDHYWIIFQKNE